VQNIQAIILAGGKSSRMMTEKGLVNLRGKPMVEYVIEVLLKTTPNICIITKNSSYESFGFPCYEDVYEGKGALGGIYTGLVRSSFEKNIVVGCDMPFISPNILQQLIDDSNEMDAVISIHNSLEEPLCSLYNKTCIPHFKKLLDDRRLKIIDALQGLKIKKINFDDKEWFKGHEFANINSMEELKKAVNWLNG
jgi:molybdopterin-guanine dinucleotide biosynthesis protein A